MEAMGPACLWCGPNQEPWGEEPRQVGAGLRPAPVPADCSAGSCWSWGSGLSQSRPQQGQWCLVEEGGRGSLSQGCALPAQPFGLGLGSSPVSCIARVFLQGIARPSLELVPGAEIIGRLPQRKASG